MQQTTVRHNAGHETDCVTPWTLILRYQLWARFAALMFSDESRRSDLKVAPNRKWRCKGQMSLSSCAPFPHVQDQTRCSHIEPRHSTCKGTIVTYLNLCVYIAGSQNNNVQAKETVRSSCLSCGHAECPLNVSKQSETRIIKERL